MYQGKYCKKTPRKSKKSVALVVSLLLLLTVTAGSTMAFLVTGDDSVSNRFTPNQVTTSVQESLSGNTKSAVSIQNTGTTDAWIRAAVIVTWQDEDGNVYGSAPVAGTDNDYTISYDVSSMNKENVWVAGNDGFYYWTSDVAPQESTDILIKSVSPVDGKTPEGYSLCVEIIASGIQSKPASVFNTEWDSSGLQVNSADTDPGKWTLEVRE